MNTMQSPELVTKKITDFLPLIIIFSVIMLFVIIRRVLYGWNLGAALNDFMAAFFLIFSAFKIYNLPMFAHAYSMYDLIAQRSIVYAYIYPFIEFLLGIAYLFRWQPVLVNCLTLVLMSISTVGVVIALQKKQQIVCACLGAVFKLPMTYVTLVEDLLMVVMALIMLIIR